MLTNWARSIFRGLLEAVAQGFRWIGVTANTLTFIGLLLQAAVAIIIALGSLPLAGILLGFFSAFDALDGTLARMTGTVSRFGAFFDATIDRYAEALILFGLLIHANNLGREDQVLLIYASIVGSLLVSYTRAKAESLNISCTVGILTRAERVVLLILGLVFGVWQPIAALPDLLTMVLWILAVLSNFTAFQRVWAVWKATEPERSAG